MLDCSSSRTGSLRKIPAVGHTFPILNWITAVRYILDARKLLSEGYRKYPNGVFRVAVHDGWLVVASGPQLVEDIRCAPEDTLNLELASARRIQLNYTLGDNFLEIPFHLGVMRAALTRNIDQRFDDIRDEIICAFEEEVGTSEEWKEVPALKMVEHIVSRVNNRFFVDTPLCRNREWMQLTIDYVVNAAVAAVFLKLMPDTLRPLVNQIFFSSNFKARRRRAHELVGPLIAERLRNIMDDGDKSQDLPSDLITWLVEACPPELRDVPLIADRILIVNFAAIHTSRITFTHMLYRLAADSRSIRPIREEIEDVLAAEGWSRLAFAKMYRLDSFVRETLRLGMPDITSMNRWVCKPFTFSNGVHIPAGYFMVCPAYAMHTDKALHGEDATEFNPWRYSDLVHDSTHQMVVTSSTLLSFGYGRNACPGRYLAANELKCMLAHVVLEYDVRFKEGTGPQPNLEIMSSVLPRDAQLEFRKRAGTKMM